VTAPDQGRVVAVGAFLVDVLAQPVAELPPEGHSEVVQDIVLTVAGAAGATAVDLAKLGVAVTAVGAVGDDALATFLTATLESFGVETGGLVRQPGLRTSASILPVRSDGRRSVWHARAAMNRLVAADVEEIDFGDVDVLHVGGPDALGRFAGQPLLDLVRRARDAGARVTLDLLGPGSGRDLERLAPLFSLVDDFLPNDSQLLRLTGRADLVTAAEVVLDMGVDHVFVTCGDAGSTVLCRDSSVAVPAMPVEMVDTTGCGDAYSAGVIVGRLLGWDAERCAELGAVTGGLVAQGLGSDAGIVDLPSTLSRLAPFADM
jgi:sugar/nucleoside kinase (ribokinase family)